MEQAKKLGVLYMQEQIHNRRNNKKIVKELGTKIKDLGLGFRV